VRLKPTLEEETDRVAAALSIYLPPGKTLELRLTNNHYSMISVRRKTDGYRLRLHRMFIDAEPRVVRALARYVVHNDRRASTLLGEYIEENQHIIRQQVRRPRKFTLRTAGRHHDLQAIFERLNRERFGGTLEARITWGPVASRRRRRRSIKMGSFAVEDRIIRIHPALDQDCVPDYFVAWIVFHEMLHGKHEVKRENGRRRFHSAEFLEEERTFPEYERACAWEKANLDRLLRV
jgi:predicted metal-dependent hydrolase